MHPITLLALCTVLTTHASPPIRLEAESGKQVGTTVDHQRPGFSGTGYVTNLRNDHDHVELQFTAPGGLYELNLRYSSPSGPKGYDISVNGAHYSGMLDKTGEVWATAPAGKILLKNGANELDINKGWGYYDVDRIDLIPAAPSPLPARLPSAPADPQATPEARALWSRLRSLYGSRMLSGQFDSDESNYVLKTTGRRPAILGGDFMDYSLSRIAHGAHPQGTTERLIAAAKSGQIITMCWHWNAPKDLYDKNYTDANGKTVEAPWYKGFYTYASEFDLAYALAHPESDDYKLILRDIDNIAGELKKFQVAHIPVLWRPLHEAEGGWFWWGAKGSKAYIQLYRLIFNRFTKVHHLHNLLWVENSLAPDWYPGDSVTDIVAVDNYPSDWRDPLSHLWDSLQKRFNGKKLLAIAEFGGAVDVDRMFAFGARWSYFVSWTGGVGPHKLTPAELTSVYRSRFMVNAPR
jgi:mannan endo-1,4-beta-mannosidase